jgi:pimeloyl-ACP methyl ester carboxylesterase
MTGSYLDLNGAKIYYEEQGSGIPIVLVHGGLTSSARWAPTVPSLADAFRVITPDSRGHGNSDNPSGELSYPQLADDLAGRGSPAFSACALRCVPCVPIW